MTYGECLCSGEYAEISSIDNALGGALSNNLELPEFREFECRVLMFIRDQIKSRENEFLCDQNSNTATDEIQLAYPEDDTTPHFLNESIYEILLSRSSIATMLIILIIAVIMGLSYNNLLCIPIKLDVPSSSKFF